MGVEMGVAMGAEAGVEVGLGVSAETEPHDEAGRRDRSSSHEKEALQEDFEKEGQGAAEWGGGMVDGVGGMVAVTVVGMCGENAR